MGKNDAERLDKWLWHLRLFKTRNRSATACKRKKIEVNGHRISKPAHRVEPGDRIRIAYRRMTKTVEVIDCPGRRIGAPRVADYLRDLTPPGEYEKKERIHLHAFALRDPGQGRPTKKERRQLEALKQVKKR